MADDFKFPHEIEESKGKPVDTESVDTDEIEIEIEDDTPEEDRGRKPGKPVDEVTDEELASYDEKVQKRIKKFTKGYHDERRAKEEALREREAAEDFARQVYEENKRLQSQLLDGSKIIVNQSKVSAQQELEAAKNFYKKAFEEGDTDKIVHAQEAISKAAVKLDKAESLKPLEPSEPRYTPAPQTPRIDNRTQSWVDKNKDWFGQDEEMTDSAMGLDKKLRRLYGADYIGTEEYFQTIDDTIRKRFPEHFDDGSYEDDPPPKKDTRTDVERRAKPANVVAPATRSTPPGRIRLKASQVAIARRLGVPIEEYAKQVALQNRG
jgi:hypothetical protein